MTGEILYDSRYGQLTPEVAEKIRKSREEVKKLKSRTLRCPVCGFRLEEIDGKQGILIPMTETEKQNINTYMHLLIPK